MPVGVLGIFVPFNVIDSDLELAVFFVDEALFADVGVEGNHGEVDSLGSFVVRKFGLP